MSYGRRKTALITGIRGQDGTYLAELLLQKGYDVIGTSHTQSARMQIPSSEATVEVEQVDLGRIDEIRDLVARVAPDEIYNLAARSSSAQLFDDAVTSADINGLAAVRFLEVIRQICPDTRFFQAGSSEVFAGSKTSPQDESTPFSPVNAYGASKCHAAHMVSAYRASYDLFAATAFLYNHESPLRGIDYVTRKISVAVARISLGEANMLELGSLESRRDWGFAGDFARAMWLILQQPSAEDFIIATGETHSVRDFCQVAFEHVGLDYQDYVRIAPSPARRAETIELRGDPRKARSKLGWEPSVGFAELVRMMVDADVARVSAASP